MAEIVNLRQAKKQAARKAGLSPADANAAKHGRTKAERGAGKARAGKGARPLDAPKPGTE